MIRKKLFELQDRAYGNFQAGLMPGVSRDKIIGVRTPALRKLAKELKGSGEAEEFLNSLPHKYYEEDNLHAFLIEQITDYDNCIKRLNEFLPHVDNWATCDCMNPKILKKHPERLLESIEGWLSSNNIYEVRFAIKKLMDHFLDERFDVRYLERVASIENTDYYIGMMKAWYFATALAKQYESAVIFLKEKRLSAPEHNKTIQKAIESLRLNAEQKAELKMMRIKNG